MRPVILGGELSKEDIKNAIPEPAATASPKIPQQPFDYDGEVYVGNNMDKKAEELPQEEEEEEDEEEEVEDNKLNSRGDVFSKLLLFWGEWIHSGWPTERLVTKLSLF